MATSLTYLAPATTELPAETGRANDRARSPALSAARTILIATLFLGALAFGAVPAWAWGGAALLVTSALFLWAWAGVRSSELRIAWTPLYLPAAAFLWLACVQLFNKITVDPIATRESIVKLVIDLAIFFLAVQLWEIRSAAASGSFAVAVTSFTGLIALFAICQFFASPETIYGVVKPRWGGWIFGPYVNHNHYAGLMEMLIPISLCVLLSMGSGSGTRPTRVLTVFALIFAVASLLLSGSRGGLLSLAAELILMALVLWRQLSRARRSRSLIGGLGAVAAAVLLFSWLDSGQIMKRFGTIADATRVTDVTLGERRALAHDTLRIFRDHPWLGIGLGSFATVYPRYRSFPSDLEWDHAHDDYVEALAETGIAGAVTIGAAFALFLILAFRNLERRLKHSSGWISLGAAVGCCGLMFHGFGDFNLHIPANAAWFSFLAGLAIAPTATKQPHQAPPGLL